MDPDPPPPSRPPTKKQPKPPQSVEELPLFARKLSKPSVPTQAARDRATTRASRAQAAAAKTASPKARTERVRWASPITWLPVVAMAMVVGGAWLLLTGQIFESNPLPAPDRSFPTVVVDAGHGGHDGGATNNGLREKDLTLDTALRLERHLRARGFPVVLTRRDDRYLELFDRAHIANQLKRALFVSVHFNDNTTASGDGVETFYAQQKAAFSDDGWLAGLFEGHADPPPLDQGAGFARAIQASMVEQLGVTDRGAKPRQLAVVRLTRCPAVLVEGGFLNNPAEARKLANEDYREKLAIAIADGIVAYHQQKLEEMRAGTLANR